MKFTNIRAKLKWFVLLVVCFTTRVCLYPKGQLISVVISCVAEKMAHVLSYRNGERSKGKSFEKMPSAVATQRITSPSAKSRSTKRRQDDTSLTSELNIFFNTFPNKIIENEQFLLQQIYEAWRTRDLDTMFRLIKVSKDSWVFNIISTFISLSEKVKLLIVIMAFLFIIWL